MGNGSRVTATRSKLGILTKIATVAIPRIRRRPRLLSTGGGWEVMSRDLDLDVDVDVDTVRDHVVHGGA
jgi:hypothetical protein